MKTKHSFKIDSEEQSCSKKTAKYNRNLSNAQLLAFFVTLMNLAGRLGSNPIFLHSNETLEFNLVCLFEINGEMFVNVFVVSNMNKQVDCSFLSMKGQLQELFPFAVKNFEHVQ